MTTVETERLEQLQTEIHRLEKLLKPLYEERKSLNEKKRKEYREALPFSPVNGWYSSGKNAVYVYWEYSSFTYYTKPLLKPSGIPYGFRTSKKSVFEQIEKLKEIGFIEAK